MSRQSDPRAARQSPSTGPAILRTPRLRFRYDPATGCYAISTVAASLLVALEAGAQLGLVRPGGIAEIRHTGSATPDGWHEEATPDGLRLTTRRLWPDGLLIIQQFELIEDVPELRSSATLRPPPGFDAAIRWFSPLAPPDDDRPNLVVSPWGQATHLLDIGWTANEPARSLPVNAGSPRELVATGLGALGSAEHGTALTVGFLEGHQAVGEYRVRLGEGEDGSRGLSFAAIARLDPIDMPDLGLELAPLSLSFAPLETALCRFARSLDAGRARPPLPPLALWQMPAQEAPPSEESTLDELSAVMNHPIATDVDYVALPAGWESRPGDWSPDPRRFPRGLRALRDQIHTQSSRAALPIAPFVVASESNLARERPTWLVRSETGDPLAVPDGRGADFYVLDASQEPVREWLKELGGLVAADWGFDLARVGHLTPETWNGWRQRGVSPLAAYREGVRAFREGLAGVPLLATDGPLFGAQDLAEILQSDAAPLLSARVTPLLRCFLREAGVPLTSGPAVVGAETQSLEEARAAATIAALSGGVASPDGNLGTLRPDRWQLWRVCLPPFPGALYPFDPFAPGGPRLFGARIDRPWEEWLLLLAINPAAAPIALRTTLAQLGLSGNHHAFEFWTQTYLGTLQERLALDQIPAHGCRVLALRPARAEPQMIGTSLHVTQGAQEVHEVAWNPLSNSLHLAVGSDGECDGTITVHLPSGWHAAGLRGTGGTFHLEPVGEHLAVIHLHFREVADVEIDFYFLPSISAAKDSALSSGS